MGCGCSGTNASTQYVYVSDLGEQTFNTEIEAKAAKVRNGNTGLVRPK